MKIKRKTIYLIVFAVSLVVLVGRYVLTSDLVDSQSVESQPQEAVADSEPEKIIEDTKEVDVDELIGALDFTCEHPKILLPKKGKKVDYGLFRVGSFENKSDKTVVGATFVVVGRDGEGNSIPIHGYNDEGQLDYGLLRITFKDLLLEPGQEADSKQLSSRIGLNENSNIKKIRAVCKEVTFQDGEVWNNPYYQDWVDKYGVVSE